MRLREDSTDRTTNLPAPLAAWLKTAEEQMRWRRARPLAAKELADHLTDQYEAFRDEGMDKDAAAQATVREMGDAIETGTQLDRAWRPKPDWVTLGMVLVIAALGCVMQYLFDYRSPTVPQLAGRYLAGAVCLLIGYFFDYTLLTRRIWTLLGIWYAVVVVVQCKICTFAIFPVDNAIRLLWLYPLLLAGLVFRLRGKGNEGLAQCLMAVAAVWVLMLVYNWNLYPMSWMLLILCSLVLLLAVCHRAFGAVKARNVALSLLPAAFGIGSTLMSRIYWSQYISPEENRSAMIQLVRSELFGIEPAFPGVTQVDINDAADWSDFMLTLMKLRWGWIAVVAILIPVILLIGRGVMMAGRQTGLLGWLVCHAVVLTLAMQAVQYLLVDLGLADTAMTFSLPLVAASARDLCLTMALLGVFLSAQRTGTLESSLVKQAKPNIE